MAIDFNYSKAIRQATDVQNAADDLQGLCKKVLRESIETLPSVWSGDAAFLYLNHLRSLEHELNLESKRLLDIAESIRRTAKIIRDAEEDAKRVQSFKRFSGGGGGRS